jgi:hypothetical protein
MIGDVEVVEEPGGVALYRRVLVGYLPRHHPGGWAVCLWCREREADGPGRAFCSDTCRAAHTRSMRPPKARFLPCPGCGRPCIKCSRYSGPGSLCVAWRWRGRVPVWRANGEPVHTSARPEELLKAKAPEHTGGV